MKLLTLMAVAFFLAACNHRFTPEMIQIADLPKQLGNVQAGKTEFGFVGITSNGVDCIYFMPREDRFDIDFEAMGEDQIPFVGRLRQFAEDNGYSCVLTTYGNTPLYKSNKPAPVVHIAANLELKDVAILGEKIEKEVFGNNEITRYEVVP